MMSDSYSLSPRRARITRVLAGLFLLVGVVSIVGTAAAMAAPGLAVRCGPNGCAGGQDLIDLAPDDARAALQRSAPARAAFAHHVARLPVRLGLGAIPLIRGLPFAALMGAAGLAVLRLGARRGNDLGSALPWLRRAAAAAVAMAVAAPVAGSLQAMLLYPGTPQGPTWYVGADFGKLAVDLLLAGAVYAVVWALDAGSRAEREVAGFV